MKKTYVYKGKEIVASSKQEAIHQIVGFYDFNKIESKLNKLKEKITLFLSSIQEIIDYLEKQRHGYSYETEITNDRAEFYIEVSFVNNNELKKKTFAMVISGFDSPSVDIQEIVDNIRIPINNKSLLTLIKEFYNVD